MRHFYLVFVCTGNICRSPMAEGIMNDLLMDEITRNNTSYPLAVTSAGTHAMAGNPASRHAVEVSKRHGIGLDFHRSKPISAELVEKADLILTMERGQTEHIRFLWPQTAAVHELKQYGRESDSGSSSTDILDPIGLDIDFYEEVFNEIRDEVTRISKRIFSLSKKKAETE